MIQTGLRISEELDEKIQQVANECDLSKNSAMKMLIRLGLKACESINFQDESLRTALRTLE